MIDFIGYINGVNFILLLSVIGLLIISITLYFENKKLSRLISRQLFNEIDSETALKKVTHK